jgi:hypothetical protein
MAYPVLLGAWYSIYVRQISYMRVRVTEMTFN